MTWDAQSLTNQKIGFSFDEPWDGFYAIGYLDGLELQLKEAPTNQAEREWRRDNGYLEGAAGVDGIDAPDGYIISFGGTPTEE